MAKTRVYFIVFLLAFFSTFFVFNVKSFLLPFIFAFVIFFIFVGDSLIESVFLTFLISLPFENSLRQFVIYHDPNPFVGYSMYFGLTPKIILGLTLILLLLLPKNRHLLNFSSKNPLLLLIFFALTCITSLFFQSRTSTVFLGFIELTIAILYYFSAIIFFTTPKTKSIFFAFTLALAIYSCVFGLLQFKKQSPLGRFIELTPFRSATSGYTTTDGQIQYRVSGFISHPVYFGSFLSILIPIIIGIYFRKKSNLFLPLVLTSIIVLLTTLSRSTWINLVVIVGLFCIHQKIKINRFVIFGTILIGILILFPTISTRIKSIPDLLANKQGSLYSRLSLANTSLKIAASSPMTGIGLNSFTLDNRSAPPHNTILIFLAELGIPTTIVFIYFVVSSLTSKVKPLKLSPTTFGVWVGLLTFVVSSQIHPLFNLDPSFDLFMLTTGYFAACQPYQT